MTQESPLSDIKVLDFSRILAGPFCTQLLGDYGAEIVKVERPGAGDDTRKWGPPYLKDDRGNDSTESAYYLSANRNKRSLTVDLVSPDGQALVKRLVPQFDMVVENFKVGGMDRYGLGYEDLKKLHPGIIYCSITGFGQDGPYAHRAGYDFMIQAMGGIMSMTGPVEAEPYKAGVGIADVMTGMYMTSAILAALHHRNKTGEGQYIDVGLLDCQVAWLVNNAQNYLVSGELPQRYGNGHPNIVPYEVFPSQDSYFALAVGNDEQFRSFCRFINREDLFENERFRTNDQRVVYREELIAILKDITCTQPTGYWLEGLEHLGIACSPINDVAQVFENPQIKHRHMKVQLPHPDAASGQVDLIGNPVKFSKSKVSYRHAPPKLGQQSAEILEEFLGMQADEIEDLQKRKVI